MTLCSDGHEEVCFEARDCPACEAVTERDGLAKELDQLREEYSDLENSIRTI